jgi:hypothetical protein
MSMKCKLIKIKFDIHINNNELLKTIWKHKEKINKLVVTGSVQQHEAQICQCTFWICPYVRRPTQENLWSTSSDLWQALKLLKGLTLCKFVNDFIIGLKAPPPHKMLTMCWNQASYVRQKEIINWKPFLLVGPSMLFWLTKWAMVASSEPASI